MRLAGPAVGAQPDQRGDHLGGGPQIFGGVPGRGRLDRRGGRAAEAGAARGGGGGRRRYGECGRGRRLVEVIDLQPGEAGATGLAPGRGRPLLLLLGLRGRVGAAPVRRVRKHRLPVAS